MVKRPLIWMVAVFIIGITSYSYGRGMFFFCLILLIFLLFIFLFTAWRHVWRLQGDWFIFILPFLFFFAYIRMEQWSVPSETESCLTTKSSGEVRGVVDQMKGSKDKFQVVLRECSLSLSETKTWNSSGVLVYLDNIDGIQHGNFIRVKGSLLPFVKASNPGQFDEFSYYKTKEITCKVFGEEFTIIHTETSSLKHVLYSLKNSMINNLLVAFPEKEAGILSLILLGEKSLIEDESNLLYKENGISHILAISGLHISLLGMGLFHLLRKILYMIPSVLIVVAVMLCYGVITNFSISASRAILMLFISLVSFLLGKTYDMISSMALAALVLLFHCPLELYSAGFQLSFSALFGISIIAPTLEKLIPCGNYSKYIRPLIMSVSIQIATIPILLYHFFEIPTYSAILNLFILPFMSIILLFALFISVIGGLIPILHVIFSGPVYFILQWFEIVCKTAEKLPIHTIVGGQPSLFKVACYYLILVGFVMYCSYGEEKEWRILFRRGSVCFPVLFLTLFFQGRKDGLQVCFLDVGQGDSIVLQVDGSTVLIDGGSSDIGKVGNYRIAPYLKHQGIAVVDYCFVTHADTDHYSGVKELLLSMDSNQDQSEIWYKGRTLIFNLVLPYAAIKDQAFLELVALAKEKNVTVIYVKTEDSIQLGEMKITCLHPSLEYKPKSRNAYSTVLSVAYGKFDMILTGDLEADGEKIVAELLENKIYEVLKIAHHGSKNSSTTIFLDAITPDFAVISCAKNNKYGHPHKETLKRLKDVNAKVMFTMEHGAVFLSSDGEFMEYGVFLETLD